MSEIKVPEMGESITEGTIAKWVVKVGDTVGQGDLLAELETDKVNLEVNAESSGVVADIRKGEGETVRVGEVIGTIREGAAAGGNAAPPAAEPAQAAAGGAADAAAAAAPQPQLQPSPAPAARDDADAARDGAYGAPLAATPSARKLARERGIDLQRVPPSDPSGRIHRLDVADARAAAAPATPPQPAASAAPVVPALDPAKPVEIVRMSRRRQTIATRLVEAQRTAAMLTTFNEVDMTKILDIRKRRKQAFQEKHDVGLGFMSFFTKAVVGALKAFPLLNAEIVGDQIVVKKYYDIGIAVAAKEGLVVPVVRDADRLGFAEIEKRIADLAGKARSNALQLADLQGGTFSITNGGVFGSLLSTPILNAPQVGILGMHKIQWRPVAIDEERMENRPMMYVALSYDHRIVDGSEAVRFLVTVKELLEDPESLLLEG
ncbi:2-oxoglutarate dehydrogenase complex dihydrolipoyllysine-residue succinyltransferase [Paenibacillus flagellatus]|uniref:Dihydrolipoyllysine-residue succinyltransferase component of 2-oxoglutarate dehydrogenase complex n=1 Tax=Paenibacillus flagellatus TaxID=2211139 RepID=A0A2V5JYS0_9BACL|nr:2-oxoglutarate dehydrogenase complex dihydrolipoyllysine-residue succinyltransferase [Paenibacillus flagellatus]PYI51891.1 dihydrolipoyllysine-residue succinyltransferase [Paenibacillus flagellatus]